MSDAGGRIACRGRGRGGDVHLAFPSVGATENLMLAAAGSAGVTRIVNAAREPEIEDLARFLRSAGVAVRGEGSSVIHIEGGGILRPAEYRIMPDRIAAATWASAAAAAGGELYLRDAVPGHLFAVTSLLAGAGCEIRHDRGGLFIRRTGVFSPSYTARTMPYPGFPTDAQAVLMATALKGKGVSSFTETIFESRFRHTAEMARMGADIRLFGRSALVFGVEKLRGAAVSAPDLRGGAALILAALAAEGESRIGNIKYVERGYEDIAGVLASVGADVEPL